eukprot:TRINITY_DN16822_c0_g1_i1.p1 TRINITY_DN16822_c0_g1~~TRINITY_DN16822_c0_g1_i1.p1  ORF type:complete len:220 (-),score=75.23 TRINITY_DN16822_c0_g1_i1:36-695(-)
MPIVISLRGDQRFGIYFDQAKKFWEQFLVLEHDIDIDCAVIHVDGVGKTLAYAGPRSINQDGLATSGIMRFDVADLDHLLEDDNDFVRTVIHEMAHVFGIGTLWDKFVTNQNPEHPYYHGLNATKRFAAHFNDDDLDDEHVMIKVANTGGEGTFGGHWNEKKFTNEILTGYHDPNEVIADFTVGALEDLGYTVTYDLFDNIDLSDAINVLNVNKILETF